MARVRPARTGFSARRAKIKAGRPLGATSPRGALSFGSLVLPPPAAQKAADLGYHLADVLVLAIAQPSPIVCQPQVSTVGWVERSATHSFSQ